VPDLPWTIHLIAQTPMLYVPRIRNTVFAAKLAPLCPFLQVAIFNQRGGILGRAGT
jgi:hypothetical protein